MEAWKRQAFAHRRQTQRTQIIVIESSESALVKTNCTLRMGRGVWGLKLDLLALGHCLEETEDQVPEPYRTFIKLLETATETCLEHSVSTRKRLVAEGLSQRPTRARFLYDVVESKLVHEADTADARLL